MLPSTSWKPAAAFHASREKVLPASQTMIFMKWRMAIVMTKL